MRGALGFEVEPSAGGRDRPEQLLLQVVEQEVNQRRHQSLQHAILLTLGKGVSSATAALFAQGKLRLTTSNGESLAPAASLSELLTQPSVSGRLLLVGPPGIGKTTALLELAAELIQRAPQQPQQPLPVLFHLSSWPVAQQSFGAWLQTEMRLKYGVSPQLSNQWLAANVLFLLLDGLDELPASCQVSAGQQINAWLSDTPGSMMVCCGCEAGDRPPLSLNLNATLELAPLTPEQLEKYLVSLALNPLWAKMQQSPELLALSCLPFWLSLVILTKETFDFAAWERLKTLPERQDFLLDGFILQQLHQPLKQQKQALENQPSAQQIRHWLSWLARHRRDQTAQEFLIENLQPTLFSNRQQIILYSLVGGLTFGAIGGIIFGLFVGPGSGIFVAGVVTFMFVVRRGDDAIAPWKEANPTLSNFVRFVFVRQIGPLLLLTVFVGLMIAITARDLGALVYGLGIGLLVGLLVRFTIAFPSWLLGGLMVGINRFLDADMTVPNQPNQPLFAMARYALRVVASFVPILLVIKALPPYLVGFSFGPGRMDGTAIASVFEVGAALALWALIFDSALVCAQHFALRFVLFQAKVLPWNYARFLDDCCDRYLLQRVGGRYQFIHRWVQERFAAL